MLFCFAFVFVFTATESKLTHFSIINFRKKLFIDVFKIFARAIARRCIKCVSVGRAGVLTTYGLPIRERRFVTTHHIYWSSSAPSACVQLCECWVQFSLNRSLIGNIFCIVVKGITFSFWCSRFSLLVYTAVIQILYLDLLFGIAPELWVSLR